MAAVTRALHSSQHVSGGLYEAAGQIAEASRAASRAEWERHVPVLPHQPQYSEVVHSPHECKVAQKSPQV